MFKSLIKSLLVLFLGFFLAMFTMFGIAGMPMMSSTDVIWGIIVLIFLWLSFGYLIYYLFFSKSLKIN